MNRFPFDWKNPVGYLIAVVLEYIIVSLALRYMGCFLGYGFGGYFFVMAIAKDLKSFVKSIGKSAKKCQSTTSEQKILQNLCEFIRLHTSVKKLMKNLTSNNIFFWADNSIFQPFFFRTLRDFTKIYKTILTVVFLGCTAAICLELLMIQLDLSQVNCCTVPFQSF